MRLRRLIEGPRLEEPSGTRGWLRVRWDPEPGAGAVTGYSVRWRKTTRTTPGFSWARVDASTHEHLLYSLEPGASYDVSVCQRGGAGTCSAWSRITMRSGTLLNFIRVSLEVPEGGGQVTLGAGENTLAWRFRVSGIDDSSGTGAAGGAVILRFRDETEVEAFGTASSPGPYATDYYQYPRYRALRHRGMHLRHLTIDGVGTGYVEEEFSVESLRDIRGKGPLMLYLLAPEADQVLGSTNMSTRGHPREICVQVNANEPCTSQQAQGGEPPVVEGVPALDGTWSEGGHVDVTVTFSEAVEVDTAGGTPSIGIVLGGPGGTAKTAGV